MVRMSWPTPANLMAATFAATLATVFVVSKWLSSPKDEWFYEKEILWPGQKFGIQMAGPMLVDTQSKYQHIQIFDSVTYGRVLVLDGAIQVTERDEFSYQEMITHLPMYSHPNPTSVLIVGGGDGGVVREVAKHPGVTRIVWCEIDEDVVKYSKEYFAKTMATAVDDPRLELHFIDAAKFVKEEASKGRKFDVIIVDSSDPVGPAETLYTADFYKDMQRGLTAGGVISTQGECLWLHLEIIGRVLGECGRLFTQVNYAFTTIPTYPSGQIGFILASNATSGTVLGAPVREPTPSVQAQMRYYSPAVHRAAFVLPQFAETAIGPHRKAIA
eukprot:m.123794 g.123794  ORF g.123794 m.123794 type:complete len:329 (-) comp22028_c0_seq2:1451-2437(-)